MRSSAPARWAVLLSAAGALSGCAVPPPFVTSYECPSWVAYDTPDDAFDSSASVAIGRVQQKVGTRTLFGATANVWSVTVDRWEKGTGPTSIEVVSPPAQCGPNGSPYMGRDPFEIASDDELSVLFLSDDGGYRAITPLQGITAAVNGAIPLDWPPGSPGSAPPR